MEAIALIADIHANLLAAEAVLSDIHKKHRPDRIISLGDQVNLGPAPRDTLRLLRSKNVTCLHGNHEGYILSAMNNDPKYAGANFASLRFNASAPQTRRNHLSKIIILFRRHLLPCPAGR